MPTKTLSRTMASSPQGLKSPTRKRSILKRPASLPLSPNPLPFAASFTVNLSPITNSPHVHFPPSASLTAHFTVHSPNTYDRGAIIVSPNPLEIPAWGDRVYSPTSDKFTPRAKANTKALSSLTRPVVSVSDLDLTLPPAKPKTRAGVRFGEVLSAQRKVKDLGVSLTSYPRSPYPSAPSTPMTQPDKENDGTADSPRIRQPVNTVYGSNPTRISSASGTNRPNFLSVPGSHQSSEPVVSSPLAQEFLSPVDEGLTPAAEAQSLSTEFWQSVVLSGADTPAADDATPITAAHPFIFGTKDGVLWSPGIPRKSQPEQASTPTPAAVLSPAATNPSFGTVTRSMAMSPSPCDPFAAFPSFSAALTLYDSDEGPITYPPAAVTVA